MTPAWMLATSLVTLLLVASAFVLARVVALYRGIPLRWVWIVATISAFVVAGLWLRPSPARALETDNAAVQPSVASGAVRTRVSDAAASSRAAPPAAPISRVPRVSVDAFRIRLPAMPAALGVAFRLIWMVMSLGLALMLGVAAVRLRADRSRWRADEVDGMSVLVSRDFGPALVGVVRPHIVLPEWVLSLDQPSQRAIVAHEAEHRDARDPALVLVGLLAVVVMPWNPGVWLSWRGLRRAIELDCDERVVRRGIEGGEYARVLLHAWNTARGSWLASTAFAERASGLGARVEHLMRPEPRERAMRTLFGTTVAAAFVFIACVTPAPQLAQSPTVANPYPLVVIDGVRRPELPPLMRFTGRVSVETLTTPTYRIVYSGPRAVDTAARKLYPSMDDGTMMQTIDAPASVAHFGAAAKYGVVLYYTPKYRKSGGAVIAPDEGSMTVRRADPNTPASVMTGRILDNLFNGITLTPDIAAQARAIIEASNTYQGSLKGPALAIWPLRVANIAERNAQLRTLLTTDADRARFDPRSNESRPHGSPTIEDVVSSEYGNLFGYPNEQPSAFRAALPAERREQARAIIRTHINDELALYARSPGAWTDNYDQRVAMRTKRDAELRALLSTDAERAKFDKIAARLRETSVKRG